MSNRLYIGNWSWLRERMLKRRYSMSNSGLGDSDDIGLTSLDTQHGSKSSNGQQVESYFNNSYLRDRIYTDVPKINNWALSKPVPALPSDHSDSSFSKGKGTGCLNISKDSTKKILSRFAERTSMVGVPYIYTSVSYVAKIGWTLLFLAAVGAMIFHLVFLSTQFYSWPKQTKVTIEFSNLPPPAITICNANPIRKSVLHMASKPVQDLVNFASLDKYKQQIYDVLDSIGRDRNSSQDTSEGDSVAVMGSMNDEPQTNDTSQSLRKRRFAEDLLALNLTDEIGEPISANSDADPLHALRSNFRRLFMQQPRELRRELGHQLRHMLLQCSINGKKCRAKAFTTFQSDEFGNCYTLQLDQTSIEEPGGDHGIEMILFLETEEFIHGVTDGNGARLVIHDRQTLPFPTEEGLSVPAGFETSIGLKMKTLARLGKPYGECKDESQFTQKYGVKYTFQTCLTLCRAHHVFETCRCMGPRTEEYLIKMNISKISNPCTTGKEKRCVAKFMDKYRQKTLDCDCPQSCKSNDYSKSVSMRQYPSNEYVYKLLLAVCEDYPRKCQAMENILDDPQKLSLNFLKLSIYYEDLNYEEITEAAEIEQAQFLSDIGGALGLWIGLSLLSVFEVLQLILELMKTCITRKPKSHPEKTDGNIDRKSATDDLSHK